MSQLTFTIYVDEANKKLCLVSQDQNLNIMQAGFFVIARFEKDNNSGFFLITKMVKNWVFPFLQDNHYASI